MTYQGWTNYETWAVSLWIDNEYGSCLYWKEATADVMNNEDAVGDAPYELSMRLKNEIEEAAPELQGLYSDLLNSALQEVDWLQIAESLIAAANENAAVPPAPLK